MYESECKLYHQHLRHGADAEDIHGDADLHGRTCNQQNHPALVAVITRQSLINRVRPIVYDTSRLYLKNSSDNSRVMANLPLPLTHAYARARIRTCSKSTFQIVAISRHIVQLRRLSRDDALTNRDRDSVVRRYRAISLVSRATRARHARANRSAFLPLCALLPINRAISILAPRRRRQRQRRWQRR